MRPSHEKGFSLCELMIVIAIIAVIAAIAIPNLLRAREATRQAQLKEPTEAEKAAMVRRMAERAKAAEAERAKAATKERELPAVALKAITVGNHSYIPVNTTGDVNALAEHVLNIVRAFETAHPDFGTTTWNLERDGNRIIGIWINHVEK